MWYYCLVETNTMDKEAILYSWNQVKFSLSCPSTDITVVIPIIITKHDAYNIAEVRFHRKKTLSISTKCN